MSMTPKQVKKYLQNKLNISEGDDGLLILHAIKENIDLCGDDDIKAIEEQGDIIIKLANCHMLTNDELLGFFGTTVEAVIKQAGEEFIKERGMYRTLICSPSLSKMCEMFFDAWMTASYKDNPMRCRIRRIGLDMYKIVGVTPDDNEIDYPKIFTVAETLKYSNCSIEYLNEMPLLN